MAAIVKGKIEKEFSAQGYSLLGIDEVGRGCLAGPVYAACVSLDYSALALLTDKERDLVRDSKKLSRLQRQRILPTIKHIANEAYIAHATAREIEELGILDATFLAMRRAISLCSSLYDMVLIDGNIKIRQYAGRQTCVIGGDSSCYAIAAASILAKEARDKFMANQAEKFPVYGFESHVGYGTKKHMDALKEHGLCDLHRRNFAPVKKLLTTSSAPTHS